MFILLGTSADVMLPTIVSRCQCVPFRLVSPAVAAQAVSRATGQDLARCRMAVAVAGSPTRGIEFLRAPSARTLAARWFAPSIRLSPPTRLMCSASPSHSSSPLGAARRGQVHAGKGA